MTTIRTAVTATVSSPVWASHNRETGTTLLTLTYSDQTFSGRETITITREDGTQLGQPIDVNHDLRGGTIGPWDQLPFVAQTDPAQPTITIPADAWQAALARLGVEP